MTARRRSGGARPLIIERIRAWLARPAASGAPRSADMDDAVPPGILARHPELVAVGEAIEQHRRGEAILARCNVCGRTLNVTEVAEVGALVVTCPDGHVSFRASRDKSRLRPGVPMG